MQICNSQQIFMVFYAICWGFVGNVTGRWNAFNWALFCRPIRSGDEDAELTKLTVDLSKMKVKEDVAKLFEKNVPAPPLRRPATLRLFLLIVFFNIIPILYFGLVINVLDPNCEAFNLSFILASVVPAFAPFGFYRLWQGIVELRPNWFYLSIAQRTTWMPGKWLFSDPTYVAPEHWIKNRERSQFMVLREGRLVDLPVVHIGDRTSGFFNLGGGTLYIVVCLLFAFLSR